ncbi:MAG TPA: acyltransferase [Acidobacteriaceae bacterium]|nr:acyltransferase [Acidobacteriaceae bacterium]
MQPIDRAVRIPTLDGWRGVAILAVLINHIAFSTRFRIFLWAQQGLTAVDVFFVISGYIITARLLQEGGELNLTAFYCRRAIRILPPVIVYLSALAAFAAIGLVHGVTPAELLGSLFFFRNYQPLLPPDHGVYTIHFWSLAVEEHFYFLWPALLAFLRPRRALYLASIGALACALWRHYYLVAAVAGGRSLYLASLRTDCRFDGLLIGCSLAILTSSPSARAWIRRNVPKETPILCGFPALLLVASAPNLPSLWLYLLIGIALGATLFAEQGVAHKWLNLPPLVWLGRISYGLYVYQEVFLMHPGNALHRPWQSFPLNLLLSLSVATVSYYVFERPLSRMAHTLFPAIPHPQSTFVTSGRNQEPTYF